MKKDNFGNKNSPQAKPSSKNGLPIVVNSTTVTSTVLASPPATLALMTTGHRHPLCPPPAASSQARTLYRLVKNNPVQSADFKTTEEEGAHRSKDSCQRSSISLWETEEHAKSVRKNIPSMTGRLIAFGVVNAGLMQQTNGPGHWSWWPPIEFHRHLLFKVV